MWKWVCSCGHENRIEDGVANKVRRVATRIVTVRSGRKAGQLKREAVRVATEIRHSCRGCGMAIIVGGGQVRLADRQMEVRA